MASKLNQYNKTHGAVWRWTTDGDYTVERAVPKARNLGNEPDEFVLPGPGPVSCGPEPAEPYRPEGQFLTAVLGGDVHLRTFDGRSYENQATGEFLVYEDPATVIQARLEPWPGQDSASIATAVAVQVDGLVVSMHLGGGTWIDGASAELPRGEAVAFGEAELLRWLQGWVIVSPDGTVVRIQDVGTAVVLLVTPAGTDSVGLLGGMDGDPDNDFVTRDGRQLPADADADFDGFYAPGGFVDSWRISSGESLFHYEPGEATESFVIAGFPAVPSHEVEFTFEDLSRAEETCSAAGVTRTDALEDCLYDVAITGHSSFAFAALVAQEATPDDPAGGAGTGVEVTRPSVDGGSIVVFDDVVIEFGSDPPIQDPSGVRPRWQCTSDDGSFFATSRFAETPTRMLDIAIEYLDGSRNNTGGDRLSAIVKLNDEDYAWALSYDDRFADLSIDFDGTSLRAGGSGFLNEPLDTRLHPIVVLPDDAELSTFALEATCGG